MIPRQLLFALITHAVEHQGTAKLSAIDPCALFRYYADITAEPPMKLSLYSLLIFSFSLAACDGSDSKVKSSEAENMDEDGAIDDGVDDADDGDADDGDADDADADDADADDADADDADGGDADGGSISPPGPGWTEGPDVPTCTPVEGDSSLVALSGILLSTDGPTAGEVVYNRDSGLIVCVGPDLTCDVEEVTRICTDGIISPGLIDAHNHMQYNVLGPWQHEELFENRYGWQSDGDYWDFRVAFDEIANSLKCEIMKWAELRSLVGGATAVVGSSGGACIDPLIRNLDEGSSSSGIDGYELYYSSGRVMDSFGEGDIITPGGSFDAVETHVGEGIGGSVTGEISHMLDIGMAGAGQIYVHATDATTEQLARMADQGSAIAWSPRSNLDLYAATTPADIAHRLGVPVALTPDWTWSGSMSPAREMTCANEWLNSRGSDISDVTLWSWTTSEAARILNLDGIIGSLEPGLKADISVFSWSDEPYRTVIEADPRDVQLVMVEGNALYGKTEWVDALTHEPSWCEAIDACESSRSICAQAGPSGDDAQSAEEIEEILSGGLSAVSVPTELEYTNDLFGLFLCEDTRDSCDVAEPTSTDTDGDGIADTEDGCPDAYDPLQRDHDGDGVGDVCDPCPLAAEMTECSHTPGDIDGDGHETESDNCPWIYNEDQFDTDGDAIGDACDPCPEEASGEGGCSYTIPEIRDPASERVVAEGSRVTIHDAVVTAIRADAGFYIQDPEAERFAGIYVHDEGAYSDGTITVGEQISITGMYIEYYNLSELTDVEVLETTAGILPEPIDISDLCTVGTEGSMAEEYENMLVRVSDLTVTNSNPDTPEDYGEFEVGDCLRIDDQLTDILVPQPPVGTHFSHIAGIHTFTYGHAKIEPRGTEDVAE
jgi:large repetitive protein